MGHDPGFPRRGTRAMVRHKAAVHRGAAALLPLILTALGAWASAAPEPSEPPGPADPLIATLIAAHNRERASEKKPPLAYNAQLEAAARVQARDMAERDAMSHEGSDGSTPAQRIERQGYRGRRIGENVAEGQESVAEVMKTWMNSPPHRENLLGDFSEIGAARALARDGTPYWCVDFGLGWLKLDPDVASADLIKAINQARTKANRPAFPTNPALTAAAQKYASALGEREGQETKKDEAPNPLQRLAESDRRFRRLGALVAAGAATPAEAIKTWVGSDSQRETLLGDEFSEVGAGYATAPNGTPYWVVILGRTVR
jgi:uncharacterized protein YkwD